MLTINCGMKVGCVVWMCSTLNVGAGYGRVVFANLPTLAEMGGLVDSSGVAEISESFQSEAEVPENIEQQPLAWKGLCRQGHCCDQVTKQRVGRH